jgi:uncharacterized Tic20 family protein
MSGTNEPMPVMSSTPDDRLFAMLCHLGTLVTVVPFANIIVPLVIWFIKKDKSPLVNDQGKEALNFQITIMIGYVIGFVLVLFVVGIFLLIALGIYHLIFSIIAAIKAYDGNAYRYPFTLRLIT